MSFHSYLPFPSLLSSALLFSSVFLNFCYPVLQRHFSQLTFFILFLLHFYFVFESLNSSLHFLQLCIHSFILLYSILLSITTVGCDSEESSYPLRSAHTVLRCLRCWVLHGMHCSSF